MTIRKVIPLCPDHLEPMNRLQTVAGLRDPKDTMTLHLCDEAGCSSAYNTSLGYMHVDGEQLVADEESPRCAICGGKLFLESVEDDLEVWKCRFSRCTGALSRRR